MARATLVLMHHSGFPSCVLALDDIGLHEGREASGELIAAHRGGPVRILSGHIHRPLQAVWHGCLCAIGGSPAFYVELRLEPDRTKPVIVHEPFRHFIHKVDSADDVTIHL